MTEAYHYPKRFHVRKGKTNPRRLAYLWLLLFAAPSEWPMLAIGMVLVTTAVLLHGWAAGYLARAGYVERETVLTVRGPYRHNRNPYYLAHLTMDLGFFFLAGVPLFYLIYFPVIFFHYRRWVINEERFLEDEFGEDYRQLKKDVPRWGFRLKPAPPRGREQGFDWATFRLNREWQRALPHLFLLGVFVFFFFFGNPLVPIDLLVRITIIGCVAVWLALHDIYPLDISRKSASWTLLALGIVLATPIFLNNAPLWEFWSGAAAWISIAVGLYLGLLVSATAFPGFSQWAGKKNKGVFAQPMSQWYVLGLGLGLLTCTLGGVWLGIMLPLTLWALGIAGWVGLRMAPQRIHTSVGLFLLTLFWGSLAVARLIE